MKAGTTLAVLHGSNLGTCRALTKLLAEEANGLGCTATVAPLDDFASVLPEADAIVIVASSYNGQPTDDAREFLSWLLGDLLRAHWRRREPGARLAHRPGGVRSLREDVWAG